MPALMISSTRVSWRRSLCTSSPSGALPCSCRRCPYPWVYTPLQCRNPCPTCPVPCLLQQLDHHLLRVVSGVGCQSLGDDHQAIGISLDPKPCLALNCFQKLLEHCMTCNLVSSRTRHHASVLQSVLDSTKSISDRILHLGERVLVRTLHHPC